jgi:streptogramin lyase
MILVIVGGWAVLVRDWGESGQGGLTGDAPTRLRATYGATVDVPAGVVDLLGEGTSIWVSGFGSVTRLDALTGEEVAAIETPRTDDWSGLAFGEGSVWATGTGGELYRIDPVTNRVVANIEVPGSVMDVAVGGGSVWVTRPSEFGEIYRIDPMTNAIVGEPIEVGPGPGPISTGLGSVWVTDTSPPALVRFDPDTGELSKVDVDNLAVGAVVVSHGSIWVPAEGGVVRIDPGSGQTIATIRVPRVAKITSGDGLIWVLASPESRSSGVYNPIDGTAALWAIDPETNSILGPPVLFGGLQPIAIASTDGAIWIGDYSGLEVRRFDLIPCAEPTCES